MAQEIGATTVALLGNGGGIIKGVSEYPLIVPSSDTPRIQEVHTLFSHIICEMIEERLVEMKGKDKAIFPIQQ